MNVIDGYRSEFSDADGRATEGVESAVHRKSARPAS